MDINGKGSRGHTTHKQTIHHSIVFIWQVSTSGRGREREKLKAKGGERQILVSILFNRYDRLLTDF